MAQCRMHMAALLTWIAHADLGGSQTSPMPDGVACQTPQGEMKRGSRLPAWGVLDGQATLCPIANRARQLSMQCPNNKDSQ